MPDRAPLANTLARRFALVAAALATAALLLVTFSSFWLVDRQHERATRLLEKKEADFHATSISRSLHRLALRMAEVAESSILATGLVDSAGKETYLTPYLASIRQVNGIPIEILFADFEGKEIARNGDVSFSPQQLAWLRAQLEIGQASAQVFQSDAGPELVATELMRYARTPTPEGAVMYKVMLADLEPAPGAYLRWGEAPAGVRAEPGTDIVQLDVPPIFRALGLHLVEQRRAGSPDGAVPQYVVILVIALGLAGIVYVIGSRLALVLTADLRRLEAFSSSVMREGFSRQRAEVSGSAEVASLAHSINHMLDRLYEQHALLQQESDKLHQLANTIPQLAWIADADGNIHWYNERWYAYTGSAPGQPDESLWQRTTPEACTRLHDAIAAGEPFQLTMRVRGADGIAHPFLTSAAPLRGNDGAIVQWFGTNTDVSPIERAERAVRESEERLREGMFAARMTVWDWDLRNDRISYSDNAQDVFGCAPGQVGSRWEVVHPDDRADLKAAIGNAIAGCGSYEKVVRMAGQAKERESNGAEATPDAVGWLDMRGHVLCDEHGNPCSIRGIAIDISARKRAEDALLAANRRKDDFLAMLAHELRNPLAPISTAAQILQRIPVDARVRELSEIIGRQVDHMTNLVDDLLDVSRVTRGLIELDRETIEVEALLAGALEQVRGLIETRRHQLTLAPCRGAVWVHVDRTRMVQVLANLLNNGAKYTPEGGHLTLSTEADAHEVRIRVRDDGIGIAPELLPHVFGLFIQAERSPDRSQGGLGLGLTLVRSLTELHGGSVIAHSDGHGHGSEFTICLPRAAGPVDDAAATPVPGHSAERGAGATRAMAPVMAPKMTREMAPVMVPAMARIMVVDDNVDAALSLAMLLESRGHTVTVEHDARRALERVRQEAPQALLLDIGLPDLDGYELARRLRTVPQTRTALLIAITGYGQADDRAKSKAAGFDHHMVKPVDMAELAALLDGLGFAT